MILRVIDIGSKLIPMSFKLNAQVQIKFSMFQVSDHSFAETWTREWN